jgi:hypothetical protein
MEYIGRSLSKINAVDTINVAAASRVVGRGTDEGGDEGGGGAIKSSFICNSP